MLRINILFVLFIILTACRKEKKPDCGKYEDQFHPITEDAKAKVPYTGTDTLRFLYTDSTGTADTITYIGQGKVFSKVALEPSVKEKYCVYQNYAETYTILFKADKPGYDFTFKVDATDEIRVVLKNEQLRALIFAINWTEYGGYYPELKLNDKFYYQVNVFAKRGNSYTFNLYYTVKHGIIRIELFHHEVWQLID